MVFGLFVFVFSELMFLGYEYNWKKINKAIFIENPKETELLFTKSY